MRLPIAARSVKSVENPDIYQQSDGNIHSRLYTLDEIRRRRRTRRNTSIPRVERGTNQSCLPISFEVSKFVESFPSSTITWIARIPHRTTKPTIPFQPHRRCVMPKQQTRKIPIFIDIKPNTKSESRNNPTRTQFK